MARTAVFSTVALQIHISLVCPASTSPLEPIGLLWTTVKSPQKRATFFLILAAPRDLVINSAHISSLGFFRSYRSKEEAL